MLQKIKNLKYYLLTALVAFGVGRFLTPSKTVEVEKTVFVERTHVEQVQLSEADKKAIKAARMTIKPDGTIEAEGVDMTTDYLKNYNQLSSSAETVIDHEKSKVTTRNAAGLFAMGEFNRDNKHTGYSAGGYYEFTIGKINTDAQGTYNGWAVGINYSF